MGKHTKFDSSEDESSHREKSEKKAKKRERSRSPHKEHKEREQSPRRDRKSDSRRRDDRNDRNREDNRKDWKRDRNERRNDYQKRDNQPRLSAEEIAAQRKALWGSKKAPETQSSEATSSEAAPPGGKNEKLWSSAIAATGVGSSQANKFMRLMGVKNAPKPTEDTSKLSDEKNRQDKMLNDLEKQYAVARETAHMGRGSGFGFGH